MKRSKALELLEEKINDSIFYQDYQLSTDCISEILLFLEKDLGMLPPLNEQNYHHMDNDDRITANKARFIHSWEPEDET